MDRRGLSLRSVRVPLDRASVAAASRLAIAGKLTFKCFRRSQKSEIGRCESRRGRWGGRQADESQPPNQLSGWGHSWLIP